MVRGVILNLILFVPLCFGMNDICPEALAILQGEAPLPEYAEIVPGAQQGDKKARDILAATLHQSLKAFFRRKAPKDKPPSGYILIYRPEDRDELISMTTLRVLQNLEKYDSSRAQFSTWLYAVARNEYKVFLANRAREKRYEVLKFEEELPDKKPKEWDGPSDQLEAVLDSMTAIQRKAILAKLEALKVSTAGKASKTKVTVSDAEIAEKAGLTLNQYKFAIQQAYAKIREMMPQSKVADD